MNDWRQQVADHLRRGEKIAAIKVYRNATGEGLKEAKDFVEELEQTLSTGELPPPAPPISAEDGDVLEMLRAGRKIEAIKRYRELHGVGLAEAKYAVEAMGTRAGVPQRSGCAGVLLAGTIGVGSTIGVLWWC